MNQSNTHIYSSISTGRLFLGCDRELLMSLLLICFTTVLFSPNVSGFLCSTLLMLLGYAALYYVGCSDPLWRHVYLRAVRYRHFYGSKRLIDDERK